MGTQPKTIRLASEVLQDVDELLERLEEQAADGRLAYASPSRARIIQRAVEVGLPILRKEAGLPAREERRRKRR